MNEYYLKLKNYMLQENVAAEHLCFEVSCHSVAEAAVAASASPEDFVKNICMLDADENLIVAIVKGEDRASTSRVASVLNIERPRPATPEEILDRTGFPCGGTPSFGFSAKFLVDPRVIELEVVFTGGGSENSLVKISPDAILKLNSGEVARVRK